MRAIGKGRINIDSGVAESVIPEDMLKKYVTTNESNSGHCLLFVGWRQLVEQKLQAAPPLISR